MVLPLLWDNTSLAEWLSWSHFTSEPLICTSAEGSGTGIVTQRTSWWFCHLSLLRPPLPPHLSGFWILTCTSFSRKNGNVSVSIPCDEKGVLFLCSEMFYCLMETNLDFKTAQEGVTLKENPSWLLCLTCIWSWIAAKCRAVPIVGEEQSFSYRQLGPLFHEVEWRVGCSCLYFPIL